MARLNLDALPLPLRRFYERAVEILEKEKPKLGRDFENLSITVDDLFRVAGSKIGNKKSSFGWLKALGGKSNSSQAGISLEEKAKAIKQLGKGLRSVAERINSQEMLQLANVLIEQKIN